MDRVNSQGNSNTQEMDSAELLVSSIRPGMKREFAMMMKAQSEMGGLPEGRRRVTRSQNTGSSSKASVESDGKITKKVKMSASKKTTGGGEKNPRVENVGKLEVGGVSDGEKRAQTDLVEVGSDVRVENGSAVGMLGAVGDDAEKVEAGEATGGLRRYTRSTSKLRHKEMEVGSRVGIVQSGSVVPLATSPSSKLELTEAGVVAVEGEAERPQADTVQSLRTESSLLQVGSSGREEAGGSLGGASDLEILGTIEGTARRYTRSALKKEMELETRAGLFSVHFEEEESAQPLHSELPSSQVGDDRKVGGASVPGVERTREATSGLPVMQLRRFTRSALTPRDEEMEVGARDGVVESSAVSLSTSPSKLESKISNKVESKRVPRKLKDLLETGLLEGLRVRYMHGLKGRRKPEFELQGIIQGTGLLCFCEECKGSKVVKPNQFELHAGSGNKRPPEYIFLENGKSLRDVLNACKDGHSDSLESVILNAIGRSNSTAAVCVNCHGLIPEVGAGRSMLLCDSCVPKESDPSHTQISDTTNRPEVPESAPISSSCQPEVPETAPVSSGCQPEVRERAQTSSTSQPRMKRQGKLTRKDLRMHKSVLSESVLPDGTALSYVMHGKIRLEGYKKDGAIYCTCCKEVVSPSQFEAHAGFASRRKPYMSIYTSNGVSLHQLSLELSKHRKPSSEENDDLCSICEDGGDLLCCENCPRAFHSECVGLSGVPTGTWYCKYCKNMFEKEKFDEHDANAIAAGRVPGTDPLEEITRRCIRIMESLEPDIGGCAICRGHDFSRSGFNDRTVIICDQCEKEYHVGCLREQNIDNLEALPEGEWFCSSHCRTINSALQKLIGDGEQKLPEALSEVLKNKSDRQELEQGSELDIRWRLLSGKKSSEDTRVWLSGAVSIFHDRFDPIADASTRRLDLIPHMVYGRHFKDQDFCGMYCAILMVNSVLVSAGIVRIFGEEVAELPLVATRTDCQGKGYFQSLYTCIEDLLISLNVKDLVLPAADEAESLWKNKFGFEKLGQEQLDQYRKSYNMMIFQGTSVLHKTISKAEISTVNS